MTERLLLVDPPTGRISTTYKQGVHCSQRTSFHSLRRIIAMILRMSGRRFPKQFNSLIFVVEIN
jgi:hypothetical protein